MEKTKEVLRGYGKKIIRAMKRKIKSTKPQPFPLIVPERGLTSK